MYNYGIVDYERYNQVEKNLKNVLNLASDDNSKSVEEDIYYHTAKNIGSRLNVTDYNSLSAKIMELGIGEIVITDMTDEKIILRLFDCFTCSNMKHLGKPICFFEAGILAGAVSNIRKQNMDANEVKCNALGDDFCEFEVTRGIPDKIDDTAEKNDDHDNINLLFLTINSLTLAKSNNLIQSQSQRSEETNHKLNEALKTALELNNFNQHILDSIPNYVAVIDSKGSVIRINEKYRQTLASAFIGESSITDLNWESKYTEVLETGKPAIWQQLIFGAEHVIFESPIIESNTVLRQVIPLESDFVKQLLDKITDAESEVIPRKKRTIKQESQCDKKIIIDSPEMKELVHYIKKISRTDASILIRGESGTGKTLFAKQIHQESRRSQHPFVYIDCTTIPKNFFETELFGYEPGCFTGANKSGKIGKLEMAQGGTIFLDEIGEIPIEIQSKLLRFLQEKQFEKMGSVVTKSVDVRIIAATNQPLEAMIREGLFRKDLYYRLNVINVLMPSLKERRSEIPGHIRKVLLEISAETGSEPKTIDSAGIKHLIQYDWPGNIRELENLIRRLFFLADENVIGEDIILKELTAADNLNHYERAPLTRKTNVNEKDLILKVIKDCNNNKSDAALRLGFTRQTLYNKIKKYQLL
ncbi:MAG: sigma 54-interacting transcriptional regulator [Acetobacterium sp.]|uniref:sigma 54-interacting transcriptional regulator n=1 Tax=Acetobacterium TaxID=33951 RepID=UPI0026F16CF6|nr:MULTISPECIES: sigma 54-interacting transcriptional regulator [Acetobacterium]MDZ5723715.1 sigma 54-interacting transcriptional regulator [Acetobacterium sp. K1/6]